MSKFRCRWISPILMMIVGMNIAGRNAIPQFIPLWLEFLLSIIAGILEAD